MVRVKRLTSSRTSQRANKDSNPSISLTGVNSEAEKHDEGNTHASCHNINHDLEERCSEHCSSLRTSDDYPVVGVDISEDMVTDQLSKPCDGETNIISSNLNSTTFNNFLTDMKVNSRKRIECRRKGFLQSVKPLKTYCRRKRGYASLQSVKLLKTYCRRRSGYESLGITPLLVQNSLGTKLEDIDVVHPVKKTMLCVDINTCQKETTARDGESLDIAGDMVLEKVRNGQSHVNPLAAESKNFRSPVPPGSTQEQSVELDLSEKSDIIVDETCDVLFTENNLNKSTNEMKNGASLVERKQDNVEEASLVSSETMKQHIIAQSGTAGTKKFPQEAPSVSIKRKLLVLDINGLLADIVSADDVSQESGVNPDLIIGRKAVFKRPFCDEFLEFCFERFSVGVWSSRVKKNVDSVLNFLMGKERQNLLFCWDQSQCTCTRYYTRENGDKPLFFKKLNKLWENCENDLPWKRGDYDEFNTILLDDSPYKALLNPPNTAIFPYTYQFSNEKDNALGPDGDLRIYLEGLSMALNVQEYVKQNPYGQDPITENHASWSFYHEVIESTVLGSLRNPSSEKLQKDVSQVISTSVVFESSKVCLDNNGAFQQLEAAELNRQLMKNANADDNSAGSPSSIQRGCKRGRGSRSQSPRHETSRSQSRSLSPKKCRRSKSPAPSHGSGFGDYKARSHQTLHSECWNFSQGRCLRGTSCRFVHHQSHRQSHADRRFKQHEGEICEHKPMPRECYEFIQGKCKWGGSCRFVHSVPDNSDSDHGTEGNETHGKQSDNVRSNKAAPQECYDFIQGKCKWGESCRFLHSVPNKADHGTEGNETHGKQLDNVKSDKAAPRECYDFIQGKCKWGESCRFLHYVPNKADHGTDGNETHGKQLDNVRSDKAAPRECYDFIQGKCKWGESCRFLHSVPNKVDHGTEGNETHGKQLDNVRSDKAAPRECYDFIQGKCKWGESCRFLHSVPKKVDHGTEGNETHGKQLDNVRSDKAAPRECYDFIQGKCKWGESCRFLHSVPNKADFGSERNETHGKQLETFRSDKAVPRECNDFIRGRCNRGASCRYLHSVPDKTDRFNSFHYRHYQDVPTSSNISDDCGKAKSSSFNEYSRYKALPEVCRNYTQGRCHRESYCRYLHQESGVTVGSGSTSQLGDTGRYKAVREVCWNYLQGNCHKGSDCLYLHQKPGLTSGSLSNSQLPDVSRYKAMPEVCRNYAQGRCHKGSECRYLHQESDNESGSTSQLDETSRYKSLPEICRHYTQGRCHKGSDCRFLHPEPGMSVGSGATSQVGETRRFNSVNEVCRNNTQGRCHKGSDCRFLHPEPGMSVGSGATSQVGETRRFNSVNEVCRNNTQGRCHKGSDCRFLHPEPGMSVGSGATSQVGETRRFNSVNEVCRNYTQGRCYKGSDCRYLHQELSLTSGSGCTAQFGETSKYQALPEICRNYIQGRCYKGSDCRYLHRESGVTVGSGSSGQFGEMRRFKALPEVCRNYTQGRCHKGSDCLYLHQEPGYCRSPQLQFSHQTTGSGMPWNTKSLPGQCVGYTRGKCWRGVHCRYMHHEDVSSNPKSFGSCGDSKSIHHETSVHEHIESRTQESRPQFSSVVEGGTVEPLPSRAIDIESFQETSIVPDDDAKHINHLENGISVSMGNLGDSDQMILDVDSIGHETTEPGTKEFIPDFPVIEDQRGILEAPASAPIDSDNSGKASVVPEVDTKGERVPENVVCAPSTDNLGNSDRMMQDSINQLEQISNL